MNGLFGRLALVVAVIAAALVVGAAPAYRFAGADLMTAFGMMRWGVYVAGGAAVLAVLWIIFAFIGRSTAGLIAFIAALVLAGAAAAGPTMMMMKASTVPPIHDITTDTANPPVFVAIAPLRADAPNGVDYKADENVEPTKAAYPDLQPLITGTPVLEMFARAEKAARAMGWEIIAAEPNEGRIEATDTTAWWGFKDDIVIRVVAEGDGSRLDIRSMSRVGKSDLGKNAERIRSFVAAVKEEK